MVSTQTTLTDPGPAARIGPNAVLQVTEALAQAGLDRLTARVFNAACVTDWLDVPPSAMVDEHRVARLHQTLRMLAPPGQSGQVLTQAGRLTADYILAHRIPRAAQALLKRSPAWLAARLLVPAIEAHAWTFAGSARFAGHAGPPTVFELTGNPFCAGEQSAIPVCAWHQAVFQRLFQVLVSPSSLAVETNCMACGDPCCRFVLDWRTPVHVDG